MTCTPRSRSQICFRRVPLIFDSVQTTQLLWFLTNTFCIRSFETFSSVDVFIFEILSTIISKTKIVPVFPKERLCLFKSSAAAKKNGSSMLIAAGSARYHVTSAFHSTQQECLARVTLHVNYMSNTFLISFPVSAIA